MMFGEWGNPDHEVSIRIIHRALDAGLNFVDTADVYSGGESEQIVAKALKGRREQVVLATKVHFPMGERPNEGGNSRRWIIQECEASLRRLGTDWIDLYQIHRWDPETDHDETLGALTDLVRAGKVRYVGSSNFAAWQIADADWTGRAAGLERFVSAQNGYSLLDRAVEDEVVPACETYGIGLLPYFPLEYGLLTGKYQRGEAAPPGSRAALDPERSQWLRDAEWDRIEALTSYAEERDLTLLDVAIAGLAAQPAVGSVISGATRGDQVRANAAALRWEPTAEDLVELDELTG